MSSGETGRDRAVFAVVVAAALYLSWLGMMVVHEAGHVLHAWASGGTVVRVVLEPLSLSRTDLGDNPAPVFVALGGFVWGSLLPVLAALPVRRPGSRLGHLLRFFAGFCLVANGVYLAGGVFSRTGDPGELLHFGVAPWLLVAGGVGLAVPGLHVWHRLGPRMGFGVHAGEGAWTTAAALVLLTALLVGVELAARG